ncbi:MAG: VWA domain-containing protein [Actinobacteria bacterium]|nr:VWA domain-containing protein [Actinomycetota bacterium]
MTAIPVADVESLRPMWIRTTLVRLALACLLILVLALAFVSARMLEPAKASLLPEGTSAVVILDVSLSVTDPVFRRIHNAIKMISEGGQGVGLVVFSDVAYEMLPPGSAPEELKGMLRYFKARSVQDPDLAVYPLSPWSAGFSAGTKISAGLELADDVLEREKIENGSIVLLSDLDTAPSDESVLSQVVANVQSKGIELRVVPLFAFEQDLTFFRQIVGKENLITPPQLAAQNRRKAESTLFGANPSMLSLLGGLVLFLLAANEWWGARVEVPRRAA